MDINDCKEIFNICYLADDTAIMEGDAGIGKSTVAKEFADENGFFMTTLFLSHQDVGDLIGNPKTIEIDGEFVTIWSKPSWLHRMEEMAEKGWKLLLFLDELNRAPIDVRQTALQLVLEKQIHEHILPRDKDGLRCLIVSAINPAGRYQVDELDMALRSRFLNLTVEANPRTWLQWAREKNVHKMVRDFITEFPKKLVYMPEDDSLGANPRSWTKLGDYLDNMNAGIEKHLFNIFKGKLGEDIGAEFYTFFQNYSTVIKIEDIEELVKTISYKTLDIQLMGNAVKELMEGTEPIQKSEMAQVLKDKYLDKPYDKALPFMAMLYSLEIEVLAGFLKPMRTSEPANYKKLVALDLVNEKALFCKISDKT